MNELLSKLNFQPHISSNDSCQPYSLLVYFYTRTDTLPVSITYAMADTPCMVTVHTGLLGSIRPSLRRCIMYGIGLEYHRKIIMEPQPHCWWPKSLVWKHGVPCLVSVDLFSHT